MLEVAGFGGVPISVRIGHAPGLVPALLVHGFGSSGKANWSATGWLADLRRAGITTVTVDLRGHGLSGKPHESAAYSLSIVLSDLRRVLAELPAVLGSVPSIDLIGYSMGGRLVGELAAAAVSGDHRTAGAQWAAGLPAVRRAVIGGYDGRPMFSHLDPRELAVFTAALAGSPGPDSPGRQLAGIAAATRGNDLTALSALVSGMNDDRTPLPAKAVALPTLVVAGERDAITGDTLRWAEGLPRARHLVLPGRDHISAVTSAVFRSAAVDFLLGQSPW